MIIGWIFAGGILLFGSIYDAKSFCLPLWLVILGLGGSLAGLWYGWACGDGSRWELLLGLVPGGLSILLAFLTREQIGYGDGLMLLMLGGCIGGQATLGTWAGGLVLSFVVSVVLLTTRKAGRSTRIPFVPCLFLGFVIVGIGGMVSGL